LTGSNLDVLTLEGPVNKTNLNRRVMLGGTLALGGISVLGGMTARGQEASPVVDEATPMADSLFAWEWPLYGNDVAGTRFTANSPIWSETANLLELAWRAPIGAAISATPVIANGLVVVGAYDGAVRAFSAADGTAVWTYETGAAVPEPLLGISIGVTGSAAIVDGVVYVGDATGKLHAISAETGEDIWTMAPDDQPAASVWSSPVIANGVLYTGIASVAKEVGFRGVVVAVDTATGATIWEHFVTPEGTDGGGVFGVPALDLERGLLVVGTQNAYTADNADSGDVMSMIALDLATGELVWSFSGVPADGSATVADDIAFSASPNLFTVQIDGADRDVVGVGQKSGIYHLLDRETGEQIWMTEITPPGPLGGMEGTSAAGNGVIVVPATMWPDFSDPNAAGVVRALDAATGEILWSQDTTAPNPAPAAIANDVAFVAGFGGVLQAFGLQDGTLLWEYDMAASVSGGIAVAGDLVVLGASTPVFAPFILEGGDLWAFRLGSPQIEPVASPEASPQA
jgi:polyvinyl alcohol dehydrogenase (cytochrome)